jgi:aryl-alcohol dehydrogenase-like predicted oxidoreductase
VQSLERSLKRLGTDYIDILWVHAWDFMTPEEEVMRGLDDQVRAGKVLYAAISDAPAWVVARCHTIAELRGWTPFVGVQIEYSLIERTPERELIPMARALELAVIAWSPLASGILSGKYGKRPPTDGSRRLDTVSFRQLDDRSQMIADAVAEIALQLGCSSPQVALAWLRQRQPAQIIPIIGARTLHQLDDDMVARLDDISAVQFGFPHEFLATTREPTYGGMFGQIDRHRDRGLSPIA